MTDITTHRLPTRTGSAIRSLLRQPGLLVSSLILITACLWALFPSLFTHYDPVIGVTAQRFQPPSSSHWFGTDAIGRDLYTRVVHGTSASLSAVALAIAIAFVSGTIIGAISGFVGGWLDDVIMRIIDILLAVPSLLISMILVTALGFGWLNIAIAVGVAAIALFSRVMRSEVLRVRTSLYVEAARASGVRWFPILFRHVIPNAIGPVLALAMLELGVAVLSISSLSFLGFGAPPPAPEWGSLIADGRAYIATAWWLTMLPGLVIVCVVLAANRVGRALERRIGSDNL